MAVAFDVASESHTGTTGSTSEASFSWSHAAAVAGVKGVVVFTSVTLEANDLATAVTYGGVSMTPVTGGRAVDTVDEPGDCKAWFLGTSVPQGTQTVVVTRTNNTSIMYAQAYTFTAATDTEPFGVVLLQEDQAVVEQNVDDGSPGTNSVRVAMIWSGFGAIAQMVAGANTTTGPSIDLGARIVRGGRETTAGQGSRPIGFDSATAVDDVAAVHLAVREVSGVATVDPYPYVGGGYYPTEG